MARSINIPKRIACAKLPQPLRRGPRDLARTPHGKTVFTDAVVAAAGLLIAREARPSSAKRQAMSINAPRAKPEAAALADEARSWADGAGALQEVVRALMDTLRRRATYPASYDFEALPNAQLAT